MNPAVLGPIYTTLQLLTAIVGKRNRSICLAKKQFDCLGKCYSPVREEDGRLTSIGYKQSSRAIIPYRLLFGVQL